MSLFQAPGKSAFAGPAEPIDCEQKYLVKLQALSDEGISKFAEPDDPAAAHNIKWIFRLATMDRTPILNTDGEPFELWAFTSNRTGRGRGKVAKARQWMEALIGRELDDGDVAEVGADQLTGKVAVALLEERDTNSDNNEGAIVNTRLTILKLSPYKGAAPKEAPALAPKPADAVPF